MIVQASLTKSHISLDVAGKGLSRGGGVDEVLAPSALTKVGWATWRSATTKSIAI